MKTPLLAAIGLRSGQTQPKTFWHCLTKLFDQRPAVQGLLAGALLAVTAPVVVQAQQWEVVPIVKPAAISAGVTPGGEGGQWPQALAADGVNGQFLLFGTDVGGIYRSLDGGARWTPCNVGYTPRGSTGFAIDPNNANYALSVGSNSYLHDFHGLYLTSNKAASWQNVLPLYQNGFQDRFRDLRDQVAYDRTSLSGGRSQVVYYSSESRGLYKSTNGGTNWTEINPNLGLACVKTHPTTGAVYVGDSTGFYRSTNGGTQFTKTLTGIVNGIDVSPNAPNVVYLTQETGVWKSTDSGLNFTKLAATGLPTVHIRWPKVSPANATRLVVYYEGENWDFRRYYSSNGGVSWTQGTIDNTLATLPYNARQGIFAWHPTNASVLWSTGGDWITKSTDAGATYRWAANGYSGILIGGAFNFNLQNPNLLFVGSQDYNGALTTDGGASWKYSDVSGNGWGGFCYGGYAASAQVQYTGNAGDWHGGRTLRITRDGGTTWTTAPGVTLTGADASYGDPTNPNILFAFNHRSTDQGRTWTPMTRCDGVFTSNPTGGRELYGRDAEELVKSTDKGATWTVVASLGAGNDIKDIAYDHVRGYVYIVADEELHRWNGTTMTTLNPPIDADNWRRIRTVAVDPTDPAIVYVGTGKDVACSNVSVSRSVDAGATWKVLTVTTPLSGTAVDGGREALCIRVHPTTRYAFVSTSCYGFWKIGPPAGTIPAVANGTYRLLARHSGKALDVNGYSQADGADVIQWGVNTGAANQQWQVTATGNGYYKLLAAHSGKALDVSGSGLSNGTRVQQWTDNGSTAQRWRIEPTSGGYYKLTAQHSGKVLDVGGASMADGATLVQWDYVSGLNQQWQLQLVAAARGVATLTTSLSAARQAVTAFPNPADEQLAVQYELAAPTTVHVQLRDALGRVRLAHTRPAAAAGSQQLDLSTTKLPAGLYLLEVRPEGADAQVVKVVISH